MSQCLLLNIEDTDHITQMNESSGFCVCCLKKTSGLVYLQNCTHSDFLYDIAIPDSSDSIDSLMDGMDCRDKCRRIKTNHKKSVNSDFSMLSVFPLRIIACYNVDGKHREETCIPEKFSTRFLKLKLQDHVVCYECHCVLKKIREFEHQVLESFNILKNKQCIPKIKSKPSRLKTEKTVDISIHCDAQTHTPLSETVDSEYGDGQKHKMESRLRNIQTALDIIEGNNSVPLMDLLSGINSLKNDVLGTVENENLNVNDTKTPPCIVDYVKNKEMDHTASLHSRRDPLKLYRHTNPIRKVKLTKEQLMRERYIQTNSKEYMKYPYKCKNCIQGFNYNENLEDHMSRKHDAKLGSTCEICAQVHPVGTLDAHMHRHFYRYLCVECLKKFSSRDDAVYHYNKDHVMRYKCVCGYIAEDLKKLWHHKAKRHKFLCQQCGVVYTTSRKLRCHVLVRHKNTSKESSQDTPSDKKYQTN